MPAMGDTQDVKSNGNGNSPCGALVVHVTDDEQ